MRLRFTPEALFELDDILTYIAARSPGGAHRVQMRLRTTFDRLSQSPEIGQATSTPGLRRIVVTPFPYLVFYEVRSDELVVIAVRHAARHPNSMP